MIVVAALFWSTINLLTAYVHTFGELNFRHAALGLGEATFGIFAPALLADFYPEASAQPRPHHLQHRRPRRSRASASSPAATSDSTSAGALQLHKSPPIPGIIIRSTHRLLHARARTRRQPARKKPRPTKPPSSRSPATRPTFAPSRYAMVTFTVGRPVLLDAHLSPARRWPLATVRRLPHGRDHRRRRPARHLWSAAPSPSAGRVPTPAPSSSSRRSVPPLPFRPTLVLFFGP